MTLDALVADAGKTVEDASATSDDGLLCRHCTVEIAAGDGYGLFPLPAATGFTLRAGLRDARWRVHRRPQPHGDARPRRGGLPRCAREGARATLAVRIASARNVDAADAHLAGALDEAARLFADAGIELVATPAIRLDVAAPPVAEAAQGDPGPLAPLADAAERALGDDAAYVPVVLVDGLPRPIRRAGRRRPSPRSPPGSAAPPPRRRGRGLRRPRQHRRRPAAARHEDRARWLGTIVAHENGHWLGLRHDQDRVVPVTAPTLMSAYVAASLPGQLAFAADQAQALTRHPLVSFLRREP